MGVWHGKGVGWRRVWWWSCGLVAVAAMAVAVVFPAPAGAAVCRTVPIATGGYHSLAIKSDGTAVGWGKNASGQLGDGTLTGRATAVAVVGLSSVSALAGGFIHSVALRSDGSVWTWGANGFGQVGDGTNTDRSTPRQVVGLGGVMAIGAGGASGFEHSIALKADGTVWGWGYNAYGQLGDGTTTSRNTAVQVAGLSGVTAIVA